MFVGPGTIDDPFTAVISRQDLEIARAGDTAELWFDVGTDDSDDVNRLSIDLAYSDIEELLRLAPEDEIVLELDSAVVEGIFGDDDFESHGMKSAIAIAVAGAALLAPAAAQAAAPQTFGTAATVQKANVAATVQVSNVASRVQALNPQAKVQVSKAQAKVQVSKTLVYKAAGFNILRATSDR
jgi:hypothetical protein